MGEAIAGALDKDLKDCAVYSREGYTGERVPGTIGFATVRAGISSANIPRCLLILARRIEITHKASSRMTLLMVREIGIVAKIKEKWSF
jgi:4-hydroxy-tetrahydrodipicolinate reductase